jgi:hypothetical protein
MIDFCLENNVLQLKKHVSIKTIEKCINKKKQNLDWRNAFFIFQIAKILFQ